MRITVNLNKAAYLILNGAELVGFDGKYWTNCKIIVDADPKLLKQSNKGLVNYQAYMIQRGKIKTRMKKAYKVF